MAITLPTTLPRPLIHGHRGCRGLFPENTLPAFLHALALGVDVLELDVVISSDNQVVVSHEPWLAVHLGWSPVGLPIALSHEYEYNLYRMSYAKIRQCQVGVLGQPLFLQQQQAPTYRPLLSEVLLVVEDACQQLGRAPVRYSIEIKSTPATDGIYHPAPAEYVSLVLNSCLPITVDRITLLSFDPRVLKTARHLKKNARLCLLTEMPFTSATVFDELGFVPNEFGPDYTLLTQQMVQDLRHYYPNLQLVCWTVNEQDDLIKIANWGTDGITTDYPDRAIDLFI